MNRKTKLVLAYKCRETVIDSKFNRLEKDDEGDEEIPNDLEGGVRRERKFSI